MIRNTMKYCSYVIFAVLFVGAKAVEYWEIKSHPIVGPIFGKGEPLRKKGDCPSEWLKQNGSCYYIEKHSKMTFAEARTMCHKVGAALFVPRTISEYNTIMDYSSYSAKFTWIGLMHKVDFEGPKWDRANGLNYTKLNWAMESEVKGTRCAASDFKENGFYNCTDYPKNRCQHFGDYGRTSFTHWKSCEDENYFICQGSAEVIAKQFEILREEYYKMMRVNKSSSMEIPINKNNNKNVTKSFPLEKCPTDWLKYNGSCYFIEKTAKVSFSEAKRICQEMDATLFTPKNIEEFNTVMSGIVPNSFTWYGISQRIPLDRPKWNAMAGLSANIYYSEMRCAVCAQDNGTISAHFEPCDDRNHYVCEGNEKIKDTIIEAKKSKFVKQSWPIFRLLQQSLKLVRFLEKDQQTNEGTANKQPQTLPNGDAVQRNPPNSKPEAMKRVLTSAGESIGKRMGKYISAKKRKMENCENGWIRFEKSCYFVERKEKANYQEASENCKKKGAVIFTPKSKEEYKSLMSYTEAYSHTWANTDAEYSNMNWLVNPFSVMANGYNSNILASCPAFYNGNIDTVKYTYFYPCDWKFYYICEKQT